MTPSFRSKITSKNMMIDAEDWEYYDKHQNKWIEDTYRDLYINLFPEHMNNDCQLVVYGESLTSMMFTVPKVEVNVGVAGSCWSSQVRVLAVGGGSIRSY